MLGAGALGYLVYKGLTGRRLLRGVPRVTVEKLHRELAAISAADRTAHYEAAIVVARNNSVITSSIGRVDGSVTANERGENGFGYDRLFELTDGRTMAEVPRAEKTQISHRAQAVRNVLPELLEAIGLSN